MRILIDKIWIAGDSPLSLMSGLTDGGSVRVFGWMPTDIAEVVAVAQAAVDGPVVMDVPDGAILVSREDPPA